MPVLKAIDAWLTRLGRQVGNTCNAFLGIALLLAFPVAAAAGLLYATLSWYGAIDGGGWIVLVAAYVTGLFLAVYVWSPVVMPAVVDAAAVLTRKR